MKSVKKSINNILHTHAFGFGVFVLLFAFFFFAGGLVVVNGQTLGPNDSHVVSLYIDGKEVTTPTRAATVGEFLDKAHITLNESDLVEPAKESTIDSDNYRVHVYTAKPVTIIDGQNIKRVLTPHESPQLIAEKAGITIYPEDILKLTTATNFVQESILGEKLIIDRATPITLSLYGSPAAIYRTHAKTVGEFLKERKITPETGATVTPALETPLQEDMPIFISKFGKQVITVEEVIPFVNDYNIDQNKPIGYKEIIKLGKNGKKQVIYEIELRDGKEIGRRSLQEVIIIATIKQEMIVGGKVVGFNGDFAAALAKLRSCEGAYTTNTGNNYYGAYQFLQSTWRKNAPAGYGDILPSEAPPDIQDQAAANLYKRSGWGSWPSCSQRLGLLDIYR